MTTITAPVYMSEFDQGKNSDKHIKYSVIDNTAVISAQVISRETSWSPEEIKQFLDLKVYLNHAMYSNPQTLLAQCNGGIDIETKENGFYIHFRLPKIPYVYLSAHFRESGDRYGNTINVHAEYSGINGFKVMVYTINNNNGNVLSKQNLEILNK